MTSKCAVRHNGLQFFISHLARWLCTRRLSESTFRPSGTTKFGKNTKGSRLFYLFAHLHLLSSDSFSFMISLLPFSSLTLTTSTFPSVHIVGTLTSKLPSTVPRVFNDTILDYPQLCSSHPTVTRLRFQTCVLSKQ